MEWLGMFQLLNRAHLKCIRSCADGAFLEVDSVSLSLSTMNSLLCSCENIITATDS